MASTSNSSGEARAVRNATASSGEGSVSMMMGRGMKESLAQLIERLLGLEMAGMLLQQIEQDRSRLVASAFQAVDAGQVQVRLVEGRRHSNALFESCYGLIA